MDKPTVKDNLTVFTANLHAFSYLGLHWMVQVYTRKYPNQKFNNQVTEEAYITYRNSV